MRPVVSCIILLGFPAGLSAQSPASHPASAPPGATAQPPAGPVAGDRVRILVEGPDSLRIGTFRSISPEQHSLAIESGSGNVEVLDLANVRAVDVSRGRSSRWATGLAIGAVGGALLGATVLADAADTGDCSEFCMIDAGTMRLGWAAIGAGGGGLIGALIGASTHSEAWEPLVAWKPDPTGGGGKLRTGARLRW